MHQMLLMNISVPLPISCTYRRCYETPCKDAKVKEMAVFVSKIYEKLKIGEEYSLHQEITDHQIDVKLVLSSTVRSFIPAYCKYVFDYTEDNRLSRLDDAASFVAEVYSEFAQLTKMQRESLAEEASIGMAHINGVTKSESYALKTVLKDRIMRDLTNNKDCDLVTYNGSSRTLQEVVSSVFTDLEHMNLFPYKCRTELRFDKSAVVVEMRMRNY